MRRGDSIPLFNLFGETSAFPDVVHCERIRERASAHGWVISAHRHDQMAQLFEIEDGEVETQLDGNTTVLKSGTFLFVPVQVVHGFSFSPGTEGKVLSFPLAVVAGFGHGSRDAADSLTRPLVGKMQGPLPVLTRLLVETFFGTGTFRTQAALGLSHAIFASLAELGQAEGGSTANASPGYLASLDALIADHMSERWRPGDYAAALSISAGHLSRLCRSARGVSASDYIEAAVMTEACRLLAFSLMPVSEIGYRLGYGDPPYFSRRFRAVQGLTPSGYRARFLG